VMVEREIGPATTRYDDDGWRIEAWAEPAQLSALVASRLAAQDGREVRLHLDRVASHDWPAESDVHALARCGVAQVEVAQEVTLGAETAPECLAFLAFVRDCMSAGLAVRWSAQLGSDVSVRALSHLAPPTGGALSALNPALAAWRQRFAYGSFYWRSGPGYTHFSDARADAFAPRWTLSDVRTVELFGLLQRPTARVALGENAATAAALDDLRIRGVIVDVGGWLVSVPYRIRRWPVMFKRERNSLQLGAGSGGT
jgi:hypothetical protein